MILEEGTRIYYTGDMANQDGFGAIYNNRDNRLHPASFVDILMDDGREIKGIFTKGISETYNGTCNPRFTTESAYYEWRDSRAS